MLLLIVQVLQLEMETVDLLSGLGGGLLSVAHTKDGVPVLAAQLSQEGKEDFLLFGNGQ